MATAWAAGRLFGALVALAAGFAERPAVVAVALSGSTLAGRTVARSVAVAQRTTFLAALLPAGRRFGRPLGDRPGEIAAGLRDDAGAELGAQIFCLDLLDGALGQFAQPERPEFDPDQSVDLQVEVAQHVAHLAVLAFADRESKPHIGALLAFERRLDGPVMDAFDGDAVAQLVQFALADPPMGADTVAPDPGGIRQFQHPGKGAVIGKQQQALGADIEPPDAHEPRQVPGERIEYRRTPLRIRIGAHQADRLVIEEQPRTLTTRQRLAVDRDAVPRRHVHGRRRDGPAIDGDTARRDPFLGVAARAQSRPRHHLGDAVGVPLLLPSPLGGGGRG